MTCDQAKCGASLRRARKAVNGLSLLEVLLVAALVSVLSTVLSLSLNYYFFQSNVQRKKAEAEQLVIKELNGLSSQAFQAAINEPISKKLFVNGQTYYLTSQVQSVVGLPEDGYRAIVVRCDWEARRPGTYQGRREVSR